MRTCGGHSLTFWQTALSAVLSTALVFQPVLAQDKPTGAPLVLSSIETEQEVPLAILLPDGKTAKCVTIRLHWNSQPDVGPNDDAASFTLDLPADNPAAPIFTAQLWSASLASALAWQEPWEGARWKVLQTPVTDGTGLDAALAVGMIATSARRPYPPKTVVIGSLNPDGSLGPVSHLIDRMDAAAQAGMTRVIIPSVQRFDTDATGQVINMVRHAGDLHLECIPVDDLVAATETTMNDPLPDSALDSSVPKYSNDVATYIDNFAQREQNEAIAGLKFAPTESELSTYPPRLAAIWKSVYADFNAGQEAYRAGQVYAAYQLFCRANGRMNGVNALAGQTRISFDVKSALEESDDLHNQLHLLMNPPSIDQGGLESAVLVAEMADWAYDIDASLEGAQLVTKQAFSQRSDATDSEKDRAREAILFANEQCKYLLTQADFYTGLLDHISKDNTAPVDPGAIGHGPKLHRWHPGQRFARRPALRSAPGRLRQRVAAGESGLGLASAQKGKRYRGRRKRAGFSISSHSGRAGRGWSRVDQAQRQRFGKCCRVRSRRYLQAAPYSAGLDGGREEIERRGVVPYLGQP
jgi:hypothetical protein